MRDIRIILDGVFNHASRGFWPFHHILENGPRSPYVDWFQILDWPLHPYHSSEERPLNYKGWWDHAALPEFNTDNPGVRDHLFGVARYWIDFGIDGWRLDVPADIDDDSFWQEFRRIVKAANPDAYLCGEIWHEAQRWLQGDQFDAVMNYLFTWNTLNFFGANTLRTDWAHPEVKLQPLDATGLVKGIDHMHSLYDWEINHVQMNLLDSHDMPRALQLLGEDKRALRLAVLFQMTMPGAPCIYYGDEVGLSAGGDPYCREAFPWYDESSWDHDLLTFYQTATVLRHSYPVLRTGSFKFLQSEDQVIAFHRQLEDQQAIVVMNSGKIAVELQIPVPDLTGKSLNQVWPVQGQNSVQVEESVLRLSLPPQEAAVLLSQTK